MAFGTDWPARIRCSRACHPVLGRREQSHLRGGRESSVVRVYGQPPLPVCGPKVDQGASLRGRAGALPGIWWSFRYCVDRSEEHTSELQSHLNLVCRLLLEKKKKSCWHKSCRVSKIRSRHGEGRLLMMQTIIV